ncbi:unnamed protein product, partial [Hapterophycus canaliculatus]
APTATVVPRWQSSRKGLSSSASAPSGVGLAHPERTISTPPERNRSRKAQNRCDGGSWGDGSNCAGNEGNPIFITRTCSDSLGSSASQAGSETDHTLRRSTSATSEAFSTGDCGFSWSNSSVKSARVSVAASTDPGVLKAEIHRLQAALMNEFKGGNRFVGGAQFKSSNASRKGHVGGTTGNSCGGCLQVREALRRSRVECRDLRGSLFRAEDVIKQLTLTKAARRRGAHNSALAQQHGTSTATSAAAKIAAGEKKRRLVSYLLASGGGSGGVSEGVGTSLSGRHDNGGGSRDLNSGDAIGARSRESLLARVQQLERELRLADFRNARTMGAAVKADHTRSRNCADETVNRYNDTDSEETPPKSKPKSRPSSESGVSNASSNNMSGRSTIARDWEDPLPCSKCCVLNDRLLREATKVNGLMRQVQEHQQESNRLRDELLDVGSARTQAIEAREELAALAKQVEGHAKHNENIEAEEIELLMAKLDHWETGDKEHEDKMRMALEQHATLQGELSTAEEALERATADADGLRAALGAQKASHDRAERTARALRKQVSEEREGFMQTRGELVAATAARRHSESQAS